MDVLDRSVLESLREDISGEDDGSDLLIDLILTFIEGIPQALSDLHQALEKANAKMLKEAAHTLKGNSAALGALHLADLCFDLEKAAKAGTIENAATMVKEIEAELERVHKAFDQEYLQTAPTDKA
ncbi:MAG: Hpt domain-containing protein [Acidobacteriota bacterium]